MTPNIVSMWKPIACIFQKGRFMLHMVKCCGFNFTSRLLSLIHWRGAKEFKQSSNWASMTRWVICLRTVMTSIMSVERSVIKGQECSIGKCIRTGIMKCLLIAALNATPKTDNHTGILLYNSGILKKTQRICTYVVMNSEFVILEISESCWCIFFSSYFEQHGHKEGILVEVNEMSLGGETICWMLFLNGSNYFYSVAWN